MTTPQQQPHTDFQAAREHFLARRFAQARTTMQRYRQAIDYNQFKQQDNRAEAKPEISIIIVGYATGPELIDCLKSVLTQQGPRFEIILVDNGQNEAIHPQLAQLPICWISPPINLLPSEGRNLGAHFARSDILVFLDDDALMAPGYLTVVQQRAQGNEYLALRGRILPKTPTATPQPKHYDQGEAEQPGKFNLEGNMVIRRSLFQKLGGFDPLMFGHEGKALTRQWRIRFPGKDIRYCPELIIRHDWAAAENLTKKRERQALGKDYLDYLKERALNAGVSIILRAGSDLSAAKAFLSNLSKHNSYKPIEVLLLTEDPHQAMNIVRTYHAQYFICVLPAGTLTISRVRKMIRYENVIIIDLPMIFNSDALLDWIRNKKTDQATALFVKADKLEINENLAYISMSRLATKLDNNIKAHTEEITRKPQTTTLQVSQVAVNTFNDKPKSISLLESRLNEIEKDLEGKNRKHKIQEESNTPNKGVVVNKNVDHGLLPAKRKVIAGMATIPERLSTLPMVLERLISQFDEIYVYLNGHESIPECVRYANIKYAWSKYNGDLGARGKFYFLDQAEGDAYYFTLDDDFLYPDDYVSYMIGTLSKYKDRVAVCVHGSIFGSPLEWYFERTKVFSSKSMLETDKFVNLIGSGTFAFNRSVLPLKFADFYPKTMCDLHASIKARRLEVPIVSVKREADWLKTIEVDKLAQDGNDYWSKMLIDDEGRSELAKSVDWSYGACNGYIKRTMEDIYPSLSEKDIIDLSLDRELLTALSADKIPESWNSAYSLLYHQRKYQYLLKELKIEEYESIHGARDIGNNYLNKDNILVLPKGKNKNIAFYNKEIGVLLNKIKSLRDGRGR